MKKKEQGFTLLELVVCFVLFAILLERLWSFFTNVYGEYLQFDKKVALNNEADMVETFLKDYIRGADKIRIKTTEGKIIEVITPIDTMMATPTPSPSLPLITNPNINNTDVEGDLESIEIETKVIPSGKNKYEIKESQVKLINNSTPTGTQGKKALFYEVTKVTKPGGVVTGGNKNLISDQIENIKVISKKDSDLVKFICTLHKKDETNNRLKVIFSWTENLTYKEKF